MYNEQIIESVWQKANIVEGFNPNVWRQDFAGAWIRRELYGSESAPYGWTINLLRPLNQGGTDVLNNLFPMQWENNNAKAGNFPQFETVVTSEENRYKREVQRWQVK